MLDRIKAGISVLDNGAVTRGGAHGDPVALSFTTPPPSGVMTTGILLPCLREEPLVEKYFVCDGQSNHEENERSPQSSGDANRRAT